MKIPNQTNGHEPEFQAEGEIIISIYNHRGRITQEKSSVDKKPFVVARKGRLWKIRTADLNFETPFFEEMGCDGAIIYKLFQYDEEQLRQKHGDLKNAPSATGQIFPCDHPFGMDTSYVYLLWLAFCSSDYFLSRKDRLVVSPEQVERGQALGKVKPAKWQLNESSLPSEVEWYSEGKEYNYPVPFDGEYLFASFEANSWIEFSGLRLPGSFGLKFYFPNQLQLHPDPTQGELCLSWSIEAKVNAVRSLENFSFLPELTRKALITDGRFRGGCCPDGLLSYGSAVWMTEEEVEAKNREHGVKFEKQIHQD